AKRRRRSDLGHQRSDQPAAALALEDGGDGDAPQLVSGRQVRLFVGWRAGIQLEHPGDPGHQRSGTAKRSRSLVDAGQKAGEPKGEGPEGFHGPASISPDGKMAVMAYSPAVVNLDISDVANPKLIGKLTFRPPFVAVGAPSLHSALPLWDRNLLYVNSEAIAERCNEALNFAGLIDNRNPARPRLMSLFPLPVPPKGAPYKNF